MAVERKTLRSISELSIFKYLLVFYLIFFILSLIVTGIVFLIAWLGFASTGTSLTDLAQNFGINMEWIPGGGAIGLVLFIIGGLIGSVFYAAIGTLAMWIINIIFRISGGIELRFIQPKSGE